MTTIGIPVFNQAEFLPDAIESALNQTVNSEIIVCNDGSTDGSYEIAKKYPVKVINQANKGLASARNTLIMNMRGDYFLPLDADDMLMDNAVELLEQEIKETNADIIAPSFKCFGLNNEQVILMDNPRLDDFKTGNRIGYLAAIKKKVLLEVGGYSPRMIWGYEDLALTINLLTRGKKLITLKDVLWLYRTKEKSMIHDAQAHHNELLAQINKDFLEAQLSF